MISESLPGKAKTYRATAERMRLMAGRLRFSEARRELLDLAGRFDRLAARAEAAPTESAVERPAEGDARAA